MLGSLPFQTSAFAVGALALAGTGTVTAANVATALSNAPLFRESLMSIAHFALGCVLVSLALLAMVLIGTISHGIALMQPRTH